MNESMNGSCCLSMPSIQRASKQEFVYIRKSELSESSSQRNSRESTSETVDSEKFTSRWLVANSVLPFPPGKAKFSDSIGSPNPIET